MTAHTPLHMFVKCRPPRPVRNVLLRKDLSLHFTRWISAFHDSKGLPFNLFFFLFPHSTRKHSFLWIFMNPCPTPGANWKNPTGQFQHRKAYCSFNRAPLSGQEFRSLPLGTQVRVSLSSISVTQEKTPSLWWLPLQNPQPRGSDTSACVNLGICQGGKPEGFLADPAFKCSTVPGSDM